MPRPGSDDSRFAIHGAIQIAPQIAPQCVFLTVLVCHVVGVPAHARLATSTLAAIMVVSSIRPGVSPFAQATGHKGAASARGGLRTA